MNQAGHDKAARLAATMAPHPDARILHTLLSDPAGTARRVWRIGVVMTGVPLSVRPLRSNAIPRDIFLYMLGAGVLAFDRSEIMPGAYDGSDDIAYDLVVNHYRLTDEGRRVAGEVAE